MNSVTEHQISNIWDSLIKPLQSVNIIYQICDMSLIKSVESVNIKYQKKKKWVGEFLKF